MQKLRCGFQNERLPDPLPEISGMTLECPLRVNLVASTTSELGLLTS